MDLDSACTHFALYQGKAYLRTSKSNSPNQLVFKCVLVVKEEDNMCDGSVQALPPIPMKPIEKTTPLMRDILMNKG